MSEKLNFKFFSIHEETLDKGKLNFTDIVVLSFLIYCSQIFDNIHVTDEIIAKSLRTSKSVVRRSIARLKKSGCIGSNLTNVWDENGIMRTTRRIELQDSPVIGAKEINLKETSLGEGTIKSFSKLLRKYLHSTETNPEKRIFDSLPFSKKNNEFFKPLIERENESRRDDKKHNNVKRETGNL